MINPNLIIGGTSLGTHHPGNLVLQEQPSKGRKTRIRVTIGAPTPVDLGLSAWSVSPASGPNPVGRYWSLLNDPGLTPPPPPPPPAEPKDPSGNSGGISGAYQLGPSHCGNASSNYSLHPATRPTAELTTPSNSSALDKSDIALNEPPPTTHSADSPLHFSPVSDQAPLGDATKQPEPAPSTSTRNFLDPDTLSSGSLREQLRLVNQKINDVQRTLKTKMSMLRVPSIVLPSSRKFKMHISLHTSVSRC
ncbi:hypothetical protein BHM03_00008163 [Ensete ventricosum]|nr:hypothetical protein BHM03_00008163 [Ensete ventricosum]